MFKYVIFDHDVGGEVHSDDGFASLKELLSTVKTDVTSYDFQEEAEFLEDEKAAEDLKTWDPNAIVASLKAFDFANGFCTWHAALPGGHRELIVSFIAK